MAVDKLVDSTQLDSDLTSVANAIRTKGGTSAQLAFPAEFVSAIGDISAGDPNENLRKSIDNTLTEYIDDGLTAIKWAVPSGNKLKTFICHNVTSYTSAAFNQTYIEYLAFPKLTDAYVSYAFRAQRLKGLDLSIYRFAGNSLRDSSALTTLILRYATAPVSIASTNVFTSTPFASGKAGGTIYIPKVLYDHLGDGSSLDYKAATNWATVDGWGTITWAQIEGSIYETQYVDGTPIPTA